MIDQAIETAEGLYLVFPAWLVLVAVAMEFVTLILVGVWVNRGYLRLRFAPIFPLSAALGGYVILYVAIIVYPDETTLALRGAVFRILTFLTAMGFVHLFIDYWAATWRAIKDGEREFN